MEIIYNVAEVLVGETWYLWDRTDPQEIREEQVVMAELNYGFSALAMATAAVAANRVHRGVNSPKDVLITGVSGLVSAGALFMFGLGVAHHRNLNLRHNQLEAKS